MTESEFEVLLYRGESDMLDYKIAQYKFTNATDAEKVELLKDCLAFANSWRRETGYILIGVAKVIGQPANVVGIPMGDHFDDASIQQFVSAKTNKPVSLLYEEFEYKGLSVGVIRFNYPQSRPIYLNKDFDRLKKNAVYIKRGSSTDECRPDEISKMGASEGPSKRLAFGVEYADAATKKGVGQSFTVCPAIFDRPDWIDTPDPRIPGSSESYLSSMLSAHKRAKSKAEKFEAVQDIARFGTFTLQLSNTGTGTAEDIEIMIDIEHQEGLEFYDESDSPYDKYRGDHLARMGVNIHLNARVERTEEGWHFHLHCRRLHAKQLHTFDQLFVTANRELTVPLQASVFAHDLPDPIEVPLTLHIKPEVREYRADLPKSFGL